MEQRPLRLGDILDDYCPRERRVTNHAVVAMIEEDVKQTRCTTCDAEHVYKGGKGPRRKKPTHRRALQGSPRRHHRGQDEAAGFSRRRPSWVRRQLLRRVATPAGTRRRTRGREREACDADGRAADDDLRCRAEQVRTEAD